MLVFGQAIEIRIFPDFTSAIANLCKRKNHPQGLNKDEKADTGKCRKGDLRRAIFNANTTLTTWRSSVTLLHLLDLVQQSLLLYVLSHARSPQHLPDF
jgi:hypothetical protein